MLEDLAVKDFALIDSVSLEFGAGLNILSGETGAGKSILIGSLTFLLGGKADADAVRKGAEEARVFGTVRLEDSAKLARAWLSERGIPIEENRVLLRRTLKASGKSSAWIQDTPVTRGELSEFTSFLVDIHGQHDHQSLLKVDEHRRFLDSFAGIDSDVADFTALYVALGAKRKQRDEITNNEAQRREQGDFLSFALEEIRKAALKPTEEDDLESEEKRLAQHERLYAAIDQSAELISSHEGVVPALKKIRASLEQGSAIDASLAALSSRVESAFYELEDVSESLRQYRDALVFDPARLEEIEERLSLIYKLKKKYGKTIPDILSWATEAEAKLALLSDGENAQAQIDAEITSLEKKIYALGSSISQRRERAAARLKSSVEEVLSALGMTSTEFTVSVGKRNSSEGASLPAVPGGATMNAGPYGFDVIEFMISPNLGEPLRPLAKIASGGELSRVMLALKTALADADESGTLIFDEIDAGIGGEVALAVGAYLRRLSMRKQILCITHLASIAVRADNQIKIEKSSEQGKTVTRAYPVTGDLRVSEIARMLAGDVLSEASTSHARELLAKFAQ